MDDGCIHESNGSRDPGHYSSCATLEQLSDFSLSLLHNTVLYPDDDTRTSEPPSVLYPPSVSRYQAHSGSSETDKHGRRPAVVLNCKLEGTSFWIRSALKLPTSMDVSVDVSLLRVSLESGLG